MLRNGSNPEGRNNVSEGKKNLHDFSSNEEEGLGVAFRRNSPFYENNGVKIMEEQSEKNYTGNYVTLDDFWSLKFLVDNSFLLGYAYKSFMPYSHLFVHIGLKNEFSDLSRDWFFIHMDKNETLKEAHKRYTNESIAISQKSHGLIDMQKSGLVISKRLFQKEEHWISKASIGSIICAEPYEALVCMLLLWIIFSYRQEYVIKNARPPWYRRDRASTSIHEDLPVFVGVGRGGCSVSLGNAYFVKFQRPELVFRPSFGSEPRFLGLLCKERTLWVVLLKRSPFHSRLSGESPWLGETKPTFIAGNDVSFVGSDCYLTSVV
ncbi:hypothetical protein C1646_662808 [Rhizophagus diaphanus]|nr:hypothetical protein C1646_662808 [Rhizophagus diaphanus] [Rhizophagus sp. MUCL 43196]